MSDSQVCLVPSDLCKQVLAPADIQIGEHLVVHGVVLRGGHCVTGLLTMRCNTVCWLDELKRKSKSNKQGWSSFQESKSEPKPVVVGIVTRLSACPTHSRVKLPS